MRLLAWLVIAAVLASATVASAETTPVTDATRDPPQVPPLVGLCLEVDPCIDNGPGHCRLWEWYDDDPQVSVNPLLGLIVIDPDGCINQLVKHIKGLLPIDTPI